MTGLNSHPGEGNDFCLLNWGDRTSKRNTQACTITNSRITPALSAFSRVCTNLSTHLTIVTFKHARVLRTGVWSPRSQGQNAAHVWSVFSLFYGSTAHPGCLLKKCKCWHWQLQHSATQASLSTSKFLLTGYMGLILYSTAVATTSWSTLEGYYGGYSAATACTVASQPFVT